ncbi:MAG: acyltransferase [Massilia sp.]|nr:acyltransferase [Massilia sp.]
MTTRAGALDARFSLYLDLARACAALAVVVAHFRYFRILDDAQIALVPDFGRVAVMAFFVLSGFVIAYSAEHKNLTARSYAVARAARLYSVALPVLILAFVLATSVHGLLEVPVDEAYQLRRPWLYVPFHLAFLGDAWHFVERPPWLIPYWSLDYEAWYYVLFGVFHFLRGRRRWLVTGALLAFVGPRLWLLLPVWLSGVALYRYQSRLTFGAGRARVGWLLSVVLIGLWGWSDPETYLRGVANGLWPFPGIRMGSADRVLADYAVMVLVLLNFACARQARFDVLLRLARPIRFVAGHTFTLYLSHAVVIGLWQSVFPVERGATFDIVAIATAIGLVALALNPLTEALQRVLRRVFDAGLALGARVLA